MPMGTGPTGSDSDIARYLIERFEFGKAMKPISVARLGRGFANQAQLARGQTDAMRRDLYATVGCYAIWMADLTRALSEADAVRMTDPGRSAALVRGVNTHL